MRSIHSIVLMALLALSLPVLGCSRKDESATKAPTPLKEGAVALEEFDQQLPPDYPKDLPVYPNSVVSKGAGREGGEQGANFQSDDSADKVAAYIKSDLIKQGWNLETEVAIGGQTMMTATKPGRRANVMVHQTKDGTQIVIYHRHE